MANNRKAGLDPTSLDAIVEKTDSIQDLLREAKNVPLDKLHPNPRQPRQTFDPHALEELKASIHALGVMVPILIRPREDGYEIICGERRFRAALELGLPSIPAMIRKADDFKALRMAYEENIKREDLTALDEARFLNGLLEQGLVKTRQELAQNLGVTKGRITQKLAVLALPEPVQKAFGHHTFLGELHARSLSQLEDPKLQEKILSTIVSGQLSGRQTEALVQRHLSRRAFPHHRKAFIRYDKAVLRRDADGYTLRLPLLSADKLSLFLANLSRAIRDHRVKLPSAPDKD